jgi:hypothetical protein
MRTIRQGVVLFAKTEWIRRSSEPFASLLFAPWPLMRASTHLMVEIACAKAQSSREIAGMRNQQTVIFSLAKKRASGKVVVLNFGE